jgi:signal transduction histidine kinase
LIQIKDGPERFRVGCDADPVVRDPRLLGHEVKSAVSAAIAAAERLRRQLGNSADATEDFTELRRRLADAEHLAAALLERRPAQGLARATTDVNVLLSQIEPSLRLALNPATTLILRLSEAAGSVFARRDQLDDIVRPLVESAARAMTEGGEVVIATGSLDSLSRHWLGSESSPQRHARLTVSDTGHGRRAENWQRVLDPPAPDGTRPGARSVAGLVERLGGGLLLESTETEGCRIHVCLPAAFDRPPS